MSCEYIKERTPEAVIEKLSKIDKPFRVVSAYGTSSRHFVLIQYIEEPQPIEDKKEVKKK